MCSLKLPITAQIAPRPLGEGLGVRVNSLRNRRGEVLFIDARKLGRMETCVHKVLDDVDIEKIAGAYHNWRSHLNRHSREGGNPEGYADIAGFCKSSTLEEIKSYDFVLTPGRYVGAEAVEDDGEPFEEKMARLTETLAEQMRNGNLLDEKIKGQLARIGFDL